MKRPLVIYHNNCADGFGAAWCFHHATRMTVKHGGGFDYFGATHGTGLPPRELYENRPHIYVVDFCYDVEGLAALCAAANFVTVIDHHKTAQEIVHSFARENFNAIFDMERSGAKLAWDYLFAYLAPQLIFHIQDRDLWQFKLPGTREIQQALFSYPYDFKVWDKLMARPVSELHEEGHAILRKHHKDINEFVLDANMVRFISFAGFDDIPLINVPYTMGSDTCHVLCKDKPFAMYYYDTADKRFIGFRSAPDGEDVGAIAKRYGGGGHKHASGFSMPLEMVDTRIDPQTGPRVDLGPGAI